MSDKSNEERIIQRLDNLVDATKENTNVLKDAHTRKAASFNFQWFLIGIAVIGGIQVLAQLYAELQAAGVKNAGDGDALVKSAANWGMTQFVFMPFGYFIGGLLVAWRSPGRTIMEPALAAALVAVVMTLFQVRGIDGGGNAAICAGISYFMIALFGALIGEKVQHAAG